MSFILPIPVPYLFMILLVLRQVIKAKSPNTEMISYGVGSKKSRIKLTPVQNPSYFNLWIMKRLVFFIDVHMTLIHLYYDEIVHQANITKLQEDKQSKYFPTKKRYTAMTPFDLQLHLDVKNNPTKILCSPLMSGR